MRNMHKYEELTPFEFEQEKKRASIIYIAAAPVEYHEECNALGIDPLKGYEWCLHAAEITGGIVFPLLPIAPAGANYQTRDELRKKFEQNAPLCYPGVFSSGEVCRMLYKELLENFSQDLKFKMCVFFGSHGPAGMLIKEIVSEMSGLHDGYKKSDGYRKIAGEVNGMKVMAVGSLDYNLDIVQEYYKEKDIKRINHGGLWEAAINYAIKPEYFQPQYLDNTYPQTYGPLTEEHYEGCIRPVRSEYRKFTPEFAKNIFDMTIKRFAADVLKNYLEIEKGSC